MVYAFDTVTKRELTNGCLTENGFYLDLAKSRYLDIDIKKEVLTEGVNGLIEDTRFNRPAKDGEEFTEEGVYTITVKNKYTNRETTKLIYVGTNKILKAYVVTRLSLDEIINHINNGGIINEDGTIITSTGGTISKVEDEEVDFEINDNDDDKNMEGNGNNEFLIVIVVIMVLLLLLFSALYVLYNKKLKKKGSNK